MYRILTASKDTYITNKIISNDIRAKDANVGQAGTLDIFKLYAESTSGSDTSPTELSRVLIKFDLDPLRAMTASSLDISHNSFKCFLKLKDVYGGQTTPSKFRLLVAPLSKAFDEGGGRDIISFSDLDSSNFMTASVAGTTPEVWTFDGANKEGLLGSDDLDIITSGNLHDGEGSAAFIWKDQLFESGKEDLSIDITRIVSGVLKGQIPDHGLRISLSGTMETDDKTRFVKRFASRHATTVEHRPKIVVHYNDSQIDHHKNFYFNLTGSLFLNNFHRNQPAHMLDGRTGNEVKGSNCVVLRLESGSHDHGTFFTYSVTGSQHVIGTHAITGVYSASFAIGAFASGTLRSEIVNAASATFSTYWGSTDYKVGFHTGSLVIQNVKRSSFDNAPDKLFLNVTNLRSKYSSFEKARMRVFVENLGKEVVFKKKPLESTSEIYTQMHYRVRDAFNGKIIIPFDEKYKGTLLSTDSDGMFFDLYMDSLPSGRVYSFDFLIKDFGTDRVFTNVGSKFRVVE
mgnify:CR=1 FL=1|tara:strand:+ start:2843 stop:4384 length:1542 start_codon:yes stop_codon:yes gene_type:complete